MNHISDSSYRNHTISQTDIGSQPRNLKALLFSLALYLILPPTAANAEGAFQQDPETDGIVSIEAENYHANNANASHSWVSGNVAKNSGGASMEASPDNGTKISTGYAPFYSPRLDYEINFNRAGTHYLWVRGKKNGKNSNFLHIGLNGNAVSSAAQINRFARSWKWSNKAGKKNTAIINIAAPGIYTVNVWMMDDGFIFDKLVLTTNPDWTPSGTGPVESPIAPPVITPDPVDPYQVTTNQVSTVSYLIEGGPGSLAASDTLEVTNSRTSEVFSIIPQSNGSFSDVVNAVAGDRLNLITTNIEGNSSETTEIFAGALKIKNPYTQTGFWYIGQTHTHTLRSDGLQSGADLEAAYYDAGFDFLISTDHRGTSPLFDQPDSGLSPNPDNSDSGKDLLWISGSELGFGEVHMGAWGQSTRIQLSTTNIQEQIDETRSNGGIIALNHPEMRQPGISWNWHHEILAFQRYSLIETFNAKPRTLGDGTLEEVNHMPDAVDLADEFKQVWWIGSDDCHNTNDDNQFNRYAIVVQTNSAIINQTDILSSADSGNLYIRETSTGPEILSITVSGNTITLNLADVSQNYNVTWKKSGNVAVEQDLVVNTTASYTVTGDEGYIRAEIEGIQDMKRAYTQPLFIANSRDLSVNASSSSGNGANNLVDNNRSTAWEAQSGSGSFIVDTGAIQLLNAIRIDWSDSDARRFNYKIETSDTGAFSGEEKEVVRETYDNRSALTLDFFDEVTRYIKVSITSQSVGSGDSIIINEIEVLDSSPAGTDLYINNVTGDDANDGSSAQPWATFDHARLKLRPRDTLYFVESGTPYSGGMRLNSYIVGKHAHGKIMISGDANQHVAIDSTGEDCGICIIDSKFLVWQYFDIYNAGFANIFVSSLTKNIEIRNNRLHNSRYGLVGSGEFTLSYNQIFQNAAEGAILYRDGTNVKIYNNLFYGNGNDGLELANDWDITAEIYNNISAGNGAHALKRGIGSLVSDGYNCIDGTYSGTWNQDSNIEGDVMLLDPANRDFSLMSTSPCIDSGIDVNLESDFFGSPHFDDPDTPNLGSSGDYSKDYIDIGSVEYLP